ncbi:hypothetical protein HJ01_01880 [Flavobacterium frigoris PS1]|uniref:Uncharacterized protein n=1 Tax=Flavobacterium frigoris (strain PS1) TaxID=1086011 RepID=H7FTA4_FLAFP|nr:hypothetical protein HJ01_01880 [Flavobacterium frigoris PS1]
MILKTLLHIRFIYKLAAQQIKTVVKIYYYSISDLIEKTNYLK